jgi:LysR family hydrogen peroxide-inducible transcriptional activator
MELDQIAYFLNLAETLNFTEAARKSKISQPSLTRSIKRLEDELGGPLVCRDGKNTRLTALGRDLQIEFLRVKGVLETVSALAANSVSGKRSHLTIGVASTIAPGIFTPFWTHVLEKFPSLELQFDPMQPGEAEDEVLSGRYDICILANTPRPNVKLTVLPLFEEPHRLAMAARHPLASQDEITLEQLAELTYYDRLHCEFRSGLIKHFTDRNVVMAPRIRSEREDWVQQMVAEGAGVCSLSAYSAIVSGIVLRRVSGLKLVRRVSIVASSISVNPREVRQILQLVKGYTWPSSAP